MKTPIRCLAIALALLSPCAYGQQLVQGQFSIVEGKSYHKIIQHPDGSTLAFGWFDHVNGEYAGRLAKLDDNGKMVPSFKKVYTNDIIHYARVQQDGKILIAGLFTTINGNATKSLVRLNTDGSVDPSFTSAVNKLAPFELQSDGKIITIASNEFVRLNTNGTIDPTFSMQNYIYEYTDFAIAPDDHIYFKATSTLHKLKPDGADDATFHVGTGIGNGFIFTIKPLRDGKVMIGGDFTSYNGAAARSIVRLNADGQIDQGFSVGNGPEGGIYSILERQNGNIIVGGQFYQYSGQPANLVELKADGTLHKIIATVSINSITSLFETADQKITIAGEFHQVNNVPRYWTARFNSDYTLNNSFVPNVSYTNSNGRVLGIRKSGAMITGGQMHDWASVYDGQHSIHKPILQYNVLGSYDFSFSAKGITNPTPVIMDAILVQSDDKVLLSGEVRGYDKPKLTRLNADGTFDNSFAIGNGPRYPSPFGDAARVFAIKQKGDVLYVAGQMASFNGVATNGIASLNLDGSVKKAYPLVPADISIIDFEFQSDGKMIAIGSMPSDGSYKQIMRLNADGSPDNTFAELNIAGSFYSIQVDANDRIYLGGWFATVNGTIANNIIRLSKDGNVDPAFNPGTGFDREILSIVLLPDGNLAAGGYFAKYKGVPANGFVMLDATGANVTPSAIKFGLNSNVVAMAYSGGALFLAGRLVKEDNTGVSGHVKIALSPPVMPDAAPANLTVSLQTAGVFNIQWEDQSANELAFVLERSTGNSSQFTAIDTVSSNVISTTDAGVQANQEYFYRVKAVNDAGGSAYSNVASFRWVPVSTLLPESENASISVYPVPTRDFIFAAMPNKTSTGKWWLLSTSGERVAVYGQAYDDGVVSIDVQSVAPGMYVLQHIEGKTTWQKKIIKQ